MKPMPQNINKTKQKGMKYMAEKINYYVIGGQYQYYCYGGTPTLLGAKRLATRHEEYWDNWAGWHKPAIYRAEDTVEVENFYGTTRAPKEFAEPVA